MLKILLEKIAECLLKGNTIWYPSSHLIIINMHITIYI